MDGQSEFAPGNDLQGLGDRLKFLQRPLDCVQFFQSGLKSVDQAVVCGNLLDRRKMQHGTLLSAESRNVGVRSVRPFCLRQ